MTPTRLLCAAALLFAPVLAPAQDADGSRDHPLLTRMPGYYIDEYRQSGFGRFDFAIGPEDAKQRVEGRATKITYCHAGESDTVPSELQILRNYIGAIERIGGRTLFVDDEYSNFMVSTSRVEHGGQEVWVGVWVYNHGHCYQLDVIEKQAMQQEVVADAASMATDIARDGRVALYGIRFDTGSATLRPESDAALAQIAELLRNQPTLALHVVGHTDNQGELGMNMTLSQQRAAAVIAALTSRHGIEPRRLDAHGVGPVSPVASNDDDDGRARNRRVELVKR